MILEGKCLEEFNEWFLLNQPLTSFIYYTDFLKAPDSMKWGVIQDYFESVAIITDIQPIFDYNDKHYTSVISYNAIAFALNYSNTSDSDSLKTLPEARTAAIESACKIRNEQLNSK